jgi:hypothetical protein
LKEAKAISISTLNYIVLEGFCREMGGRVAKIVELGKQVSRM